jgi:adenylate cyclase
MAKEIERKFLLDKPIPWDLGIQRLIKQGYVFITKNKQLRVRVIDHQSFLCFKHTKNIARDEYEYEIPLQDGLEMLGKCKYSMEKIRNTISPLGHPFTVDIDTYPNGIIVAEVEFKNEIDAQEFQPFDWFGKEITGDKTYSNITFAKQRLRF